MCVVWYSIFFFIFLMFPQNALLSFVKCCLWLLTSYSSPEQRGLVFCFVFCLLVCVFLCSFFVALVFCVCSSELCISSCMLSLSGVTFKNISLTRCCIHIVVFMSPISNQNFISWFKFRTIVIVLNLLSACRFIKSAQQHSNVLYDNITLFLPKLSKTLVPNPRFVSHLGVHQCIW